MMQERILDLWSSKMTADQICDEIQCSRELVFKTLRKARGAGDARASRRTAQAPARQRAIKISLLASVNATTQYIAATVGVSTRMVQIRLKDMA